MGTKPQKFMPVGAKPQKFMFDTNDFDARKVEAPLAPVFSEDEIETARRESHALGKQTGVSETRATLDQKTADCLDKITVSLDALMAGEEKREREMNIASAEIALKIISKMLPSTAQKTAFDEILSLIASTIDDRIDEPRIVAFVHDSLLEPLKAQIDKIATERGYAGKVILLAEEALAPTDCRLEWADGGAERIYNRLLMLIETEVTKAVTGLKTKSEGEKI